MFLALFPLQLALFPGEHVPLHIFEPRYKQLINECIQEDIRFGIPAYIQGNVSIYGTEVALVAVSKLYDNGEMDIVVRGTRVFKILEFQKDVPDKLYSGGTVEYQNGNSNTQAETVKELREKFSDLVRLMRHTSGALGKEDHELSYAIGAEAGLSLQQRVHMLSLEAEHDRQVFLIAHIDRALSAIRDRGTGAGRVSSNGRTRPNGRAKSSDRG